MWRHEDSSTCSGLWMQERQAQCSRQPGPGGGGGGRRRAARLHWEGHGDVPEVVPNDDGHRTVRKRVEQAPGAGRVAGDS